MLSVKQEITTNHSPDLGGFLTIPPNAQHILAWLEFCRDMQLVRNQSVEWITPRAAWCICQLTVHPLVTRRRKFWLSSCIAVRERVHSPCCTRREGSLRYIRPGDLEGMLISLLAAGVRAPFEQLPCGRHKLQGCFPKALLTILSQSLFQAFQVQPLSELLHAGTTSRCNRLRGWRESTILL